MAAQDVSWADKRNKFVEKRMKQLGINEGGGSQQDAAPAKTHLSKPPKVGLAKNNAAEASPKARGRARVPGVNQGGSESIFSLLGGESSTGGLNLAGGEAPTYRESTPPDAYGSVSSAGPMSGRGPGGYKSPRQAAPETGSTAGGAGGGAAKGRRTGSAPPSRQQSVDSLGTGAVVRLTDRIRASEAARGSAKGGPGIAADKKSGRASGGRSARGAKIDAEPAPAASRANEPGAIALALVPGYSTAISPRARLALATGRRTGAGAEDGPTAERVEYGSERPEYGSMQDGRGDYGSGFAGQRSQPTSGFGYGSHVDFGYGGSPAADDYQPQPQQPARLGYAAKDAMAFPMGGAGGAAGKGKGGDPFGSWASADVQPQAATKTKKEMQRAEELAREMEARRAEEEAERSAREAKVRQQESYARELAEQMEKQKRAKADEKAQRLAPQVLTRAGVAAVGSPGRLVGGMPASPIAVSGPGGPGAPDSGGRSGARPSSGIGFGRDYTDNSAPTASLVAPPLAVRGGVTGGGARGMGEYSPQRTTGAGITSAWAGMSSVDTGSSSSPAAAGGPSAYHSYQSLNTQNSYGGAGSRGSPRDGPAVSHAVAQSAAAAGAVSSEADDVLAMAGAEHGMGSGRGGARGAAGGAVVAALRTSIASLQQQVARLTDENGRLANENARLTADNSRLSFEASRLAQEVNGAKNAARMNEQGVNNLTTKLQQAVDALDRYVSMYGPLQG